MQAPPLDLTENNTVRRIVPNTAIKEVVTSYKVIDGSEHEMKVTGIEEEPQSDDDKEDKLLEGEDEGLLSCDEEHQTLSGQEGDSKAQDSSPDFPDEVNSSQSQNIDKGSVSNSQTLQIGNSGSAKISDEKTSATGRPYSQGDKKLIDLLHAIEAFDR